MYFSGVVVGVVGSPFVVFVRRPTECGHEFGGTRTGGRRNADSDSRERGQMRVVVGGVSAIVVRVSTIVGGVSAIIRNLILAVCKAR